ncbi:MAG: DUF2442 domain-containing protein [Planctomycetes bacterium]|nr:DUF2442 domain-containing protein [Planctomycetota bacterium]MBI3834617.1 DUF2442 domain-containing protein [Planctomycetota bacterium]
MNIDVVDVETMTGHRLRLTFEDGAHREVDIGELVPFEGVFAPLSDPKYFRQVKVNPEIGTIVWPNGADLCPDVLYESSKPMNE